MARVHVAVLLLLFLVQRGVAQLICYSSMDCATGTNISMGISAEMCCMIDLDEDASFLSARQETCNKCLVYGWKGDFPREVSKGQVLDLTVGYSKGLPNVPHEFNVIYEPSEVAVNTTSVKLSTSDATVRVTVQDDSEPVKKEKRVILNLQQTQGDFTVGHILLDTATLIIPTDHVRLCEGDRDTVWLFWWPTSDGGSTVPISCGANTTGVASRKCLLNGTWTKPNVSLCSNKVFGNIKSLVEALLQKGDLVGALLALTELVEATEVMETPIFPTDLHTAIDVVNLMLTQLVEELDMGGDSINDTTVIFDVLDNLLVDTNMESFSILQDNDGGSEHVLDIAERYAIYLTHTISSEVVSLRNIAGDNLALEVERVNVKGDRDEFVFPTTRIVAELDVANGSEANVNMPQDLMLAVANINEENSASVAHVLYRNLHTFLPRDEKDKEPKGLVMSCQVASPVGVEDIGDALREDIIVTFSFPVEDDEEVSARNIQCVFWDFGSSKNHRGRWSTEGMRTKSVTRVGDIVTVTCFNSHLTNFAVLVDVDGTQTSGLEHEALRGVTYIGLSISLVCLLLTIIFFMSYGKKLFSNVNNFVHLNLAIALFIGYLVFTFGVELARENEAACNVVAALIEYFLLSAFCWMMCEGVMLYLILVVVFSSLSKKWWFFMLLGWGIPMIFVAIGLGTVHDEYGVKDESGRYKYCWLSSGNGKYAIWTFVAPMLAIIIINAVFLVMILRVVLQNRVNHKKRMQEGIRVDLVVTTLKASLVLQPLLGLTWLFGLFAINENTTVFAWLFTLSNSLQGLLIFLFHVVKNTRVWASMKKQYISFASSITGKSKSSEMTGKTTWVESDNYMSGVEKEKGQDAA